MVAIKQSGFGRKRQAVRRRTRFLALKGESPLTHPAKAPTSDFSPIQQFFSRIELFLPRRLMPQAGFFHCLHRCHNRFNRRIFSGVYN
jgi:hypothetical protein